MIGENHETTIIDGSGNEIVVLIQADNVLFDGFTVQYPTKTGILVEGNYARIFNNTIVRCIEAIICSDCDSHKIIGNNIGKNIIGLKITNSYLNLIEHNNFLENIVHATFSRSLFNVWDYNYWDKLGFKYFKIIYGNLGIFNIPWIQFDRHPAQNAYDN